MELCQEQSLGLDLFVKKLLAALVVLLHIRNANHSFAKVTLLAYILPGEAFLAFPKLQEYAELGDASLLANRLAEAPQYQYFQRALDKTAQDTPQILAHTEYGKAYPAA